MTPAKHWHNVMEDSLCTVLADDLTGACDVASEFVAGTASVRVVPGIDGFSGPRVRDLIREPGGPRVIVNTQTRTSDETTAYGKVRHVASVFRDLGSDLVFKKMDTLLRGQVAVEVKAMLDAYGDGIALVAPAFPAFSRTTVGGRQLVEGRPVEQTRFAADPFSPVGESSIPRLLARACGQRVACLPLETIRGTGLASAMEDRVRDGKDILVADAVEDSDLVSICRAAMERFRPLFLVGSLGLAGAYRIVTLNAPGSGRPVFEHRGPTLLVAGSRSERSLEQLEYAAQSGAVKLLAIRPEILQDPPSGRLHLEATALEAQEVLSSGTDAGILLRAADTPDSEGRDGVDPRKVEAVLAELTERIVSSAEVGALVVVGGDTAYSISVRLGVTTIDVIGKIEGAIPVGWIRGGVLDGVRYVSKGGGIGRADAIVSVLNALSGERRQGVMNPE